MMFDIVVCHGPNDDDTMLDLNIQYNTANVIDRKNIYVITSDQNLKRDDCIVIHESVFPFSVAEIREGSSENRYGWYLQQLIKLYAHCVIPDLSEYYLVIDCDTLFLKPTAFFENKIPLYNVGTEYHVPYFEQMYRVHKTFIKQVKESGICHHMMFSKKILREIFFIVETDYYIPNTPFWKIMIKSIDPNHIPYSGFSEYELYFNYILKFHKDKMKIRLLAWKNTSSLDLMTSGHLNYISYHYYARCKK